MIGKHKIDLVTIDGFNHRIAWELPECWLRGEDLNL